MRDPANDLRKSATALRCQLEKNIKCSVPGCDSPLTMFRGPNEGKLCREHQVKQREYGGLARIDRIYTFHKKWVCDWCKYDPRLDSWYNNPTSPWDDEEHKLRAIRSILVCDHIIPKKDGGTDKESNVQTLCQNCNTKKTINKKDYRRANIELLCDE